jgi:hypothetical protein
MIVVAVFDDTANLRGDRMLYGMMSLYHQFGIMLWGNASPSGRLTCKL